MDWVEAGTTAFGVLALLGAVLCASLTAYLAVHFGDRDSGFTAGQSQGLTPVLKGMGVILFGLGTLLAFAVGHLLVGRRLVRGLRELFGRRAASTDEDHRPWALAISGLLLAGTAWIMLAVWTSGA